MNLRSALVMLRMRPVDPLKQSAAQFTASRCTHTHTHTIKSHFAPHIKLSLDAVRLDKNSPFLLAWYRYIVVWQLKIRKAHTLNNR